MELAQGISHDANRAQVGREIDVLIESREPSASASGDAMVIGRTARDAPEVDGLALVKGTYPMGTMVRVRVDGALHVLNAPSPAATSSLAIAEHIVTQLQA